MMLIFKFNHKPLRDSTPSWIFRNAPWVSAKDHGTKKVRGASYPAEPLWIVLGDDNMTETNDQFSKSTVPQLKKYLSDRDIVVSNTLKKDLLARCRAASLLDLQPKETPQQYAAEIQIQRKSKLILDGGVISLPDPDNLQSGWEDSALSYPELIQSAVETYFDKSK